MKVVHEFVAAHGRTKMSDVISAAYLILGWFVLQLHCRGRKINPLID